MTKLLGIAAALLFVGGCGHPDIRPIGRDGAPFVPETDERELWREAEREETVIDKHVTLYRDTALEDYLGAVAAGLLPGPLRAAGAPPPRISVIADPALAAFAMPDGRLYISTGALARPESEAQLASILGHELAHVMNRDALRTWRHGGRELAAVGGGSSNLLVALGLRVASVAAVSGYAHALERMADERSLGWMLTAGYDAREAPRAWERLADPRGDPTRIERFALGRDAWLKERLTTTQELLRAQPESAAPARIARDPEAFARSTRRLLRDNARLEMRAGRFGLAGEQLERAARLAPDDPTVALYTGDLNRLRAQRAPAAEDRLALLARAREAYERAASLDPTSADPFRQLGLLYFQSRDYARARAAFERYLALSPDAPDARRIREYIIELGR